MVLEEGYFDNNQQNNLNKIKNIIDLLLKTEFRNRVNLLNNIIITSDLSKTIEKHNYVNIKETAQGATHKVAKGYDIIFNYNNLGLNDDREFANFEQYLYHELQHISDYIEYDDLIKNSSFRIGLKENESAIGRMFFHEFRAAYYSQKYIQLVSEDKYSLKVNVQDWREKYNTVIHHIETLENYVEQVKRINILASDINYDIMYDLALSCGQNTADNEIKTGEKFTNIEIKGVDMNLDKIINEFIQGINNVMMSEEESINYFLNNGLFIFHHICQLTKEKINLLKVSSID